MPVKKFNIVFEGDLTAKIYIGKNILFKILFHLLIPRTQTYILDLSTFFQIEIFPDFHFGAFYFEMHLSMPAKFERLIYLNVRYQPSIAL